MDIQVHYKRPRFYKTSKPPIRQPIYLTWLIRFLSGMMTLGIKYKVEKINMEGVKPPYMILSNHMHFVDFELCSIGTYPHRVNNVVNIDGYYQRPWLMEWIGAICTRKFTSDLHLVRSIRKSLSRGDVLCMYPEARYSPCGTTSYLPDSLGGLVKMSKVPVVAVVHRGNYLRAPFWDFRRKRKVPLHTTITQVLTAEQVKEMTADEINRAIRDALTYDDYQYQKDNGIRITEPYRAEGLHKVLYQCPHCRTEFQMASQGTRLFCRACGKGWQLGEDGQLSAETGETEFSHIPHWFEWERTQVREQIQNGTYRFEDTVDVYSMPGCWRLPYLGKAKLTHDPSEGWILEGHYNGQDYRIQRLPLQINSLHVEYDWYRIRRADCLDISTEQDSFYCYPTQENVVTKLAFATEELFQMHLSAKRQAPNRTPV